MVSTHARFDTLFREHHAALERVLGSRGVDPAEVADLAAEVWIDVLRRLPEQALNFAEIKDAEELRARSRAWVLAFGRHRALRWRRDRGRCPVRVGGEPILDVRDERDELEVTLARRSTAEAVRRALLLVTDARERALLEEIYLGGCTQAEAARERDWDESRLRRLLERAERSMRRSLTQLRVTP